MRGERGGGGHHSSTHTTSCQTSGGASSPTLSPLGLAHPHSLNQDQPYCAVLPRLDAGPALPNAAVGKGQGQLCHSHDLMASSPELLPSGMAHLCASQPAVSARLCCPGEVRGPLSQLLQLVRGRDNFPELMTLWAAFLTARGGDSQQGWGHHLCACVIPWQPSGRVSSSTLLPFRLTHPHPSHQAQLHCAA